MWARPERRGQWTWVRTAEAGARQMCCRTWQWEAGRRPRCSAVAGSLGVFEQQVRTDLERPQG